MDLIISQFSNINLETNFDELVIDNSNQIYDYKIENQVLEKFDIITSKKHSYPKKKEKWINFIQCHKNKFKIHINYNPETVLLNIIYKYPLYNFEKKMYENVLNTLKMYNIKLEIHNYKNVINYIEHFCVINIKLSINNIFDILVRRNVFTINNNKYILKKKDADINIKKRRCMNNISTIEYKKIKDE